MGIKDTFKQGMAVAGMIATIGGAVGDPVLKGATTGLVKQYSSYVKKVRIPDTKEQIDRTIQDATRAKLAAHKNTTQLTKKDLKGLK